MSLSHSPKVQMDGLVAYFDAGNSKSYPGTGTNWQSLINSSDNFLVSALTYSTDNGGGMVMDATDTTSFTPDATLASVLSSGNFAIETIVRSDDGVYPRSRHPFYSGTDASSTVEHGWVSGHTATTTSMQLGSADGTFKEFDNLPTNTVTDGEIIHRVFNVSREAGVTTNYFENGEFVGVSENPTVVGSIYEGGGMVFGSVQGWGFIGHLYIIKIYSKILTTVEIKQNFEATRGRFEI